MLQMYSTLNTNDNIISLATGVIGKYRSAGKEKVILIHSKVFYHINIFFFPLAFQIILKKKVKYLFWTKVFFVLCNISLTS